jgi:hypothetical protein
MKTSVLSLYRSEALAWKYLANEQKTALKQLRGIFLKKGFLINNSHCIPSIYINIEVNISTYSLSHIHIATHFSREAEKGRIRMIYAPARWFSVLEPLICSTFS